MWKSRSSEDYLEAIYVLGKCLPEVRSIDVANKLNFSKASVSVAMKNLREDNCIKVDSSGFITLTERGLDIATKIYNRHDFISRWLVSLGVDKATAHSDACEMEHFLSEASFKAIKEFVESNQELK